jgi:hypothetical protein
MERLAHILAWRRGAALTPLYDMVLQLSVDAIALT